MSTGSSNSATNDDSNTPSLSQLYDTLLPVFLVALAFFVAFLILRRILRRNYAPRTFLGALRQEERSPDLPTGLFNWFGKFNSIPDSYVLNHHSLDAFLLLRYLKIATATCLVGCFITWPILWPVTITGGGGQTELNKLAFPNVVNKYRYYAHTFVAWIFCSFVMYMVTRESLYYINLRQAYLLSPLYAKRMSSRTVLFASVPEEYHNEAKIRRMYGRSVKHVWLANDCEEIEKNVQERDKVAMKLEAAETKLIKLANAARLKAAKKGGSNDQEHLGATNAADGESGSAAARWVQPKQRPTHRLKPIIGKKVDTINWCRSELERLIPKVDALQAKHRTGEGKPVPALFVEFYTQAEAQSAYQGLTHHQALHMGPRWIGINPEEIIWKNLKITWASRVVRGIVTIGFVTAMVIFWAVPVAFVGSISNIASLTSTPGLTWLSFINKIPGPILGVVQGLLPAVLLGILMALVPIILRLMAKFGGAPSVPAVELTVQNSYFFFQVIQVFLVTTLASGASAAGGKIAKDPGSAPTLLAQNLPKASNFYISYFIVQGLGIASGAVLQLVGVILFMVLGKLLDTTPRKVYKRWISLSSLGWGTVFPPYTNLLVIAITYSIIAPLVLGFATLGLFLIYLAFRYNLLFVLNCKIDTKGLVYPRALQQTTTGVYLCLICLIGLFGIQAAPGPIVLTVIFLIFVILFHISLNSAIAPLLMYLPRSLDAEEDALLALEDGKTNDGNIPGEKGTHVAAQSMQHNNGFGKDGVAPPHKKPNFITKWLKPHVFTDYQTLRRLVPRGFADIAYDPITERDAYFHPAIASQTPMLWIPKDQMGISRQECLHTSKIIPISDEGAHFNEKNKLIWDQESGRPPIYQEKIYY